MPSNMTLRYDGLEDVSVVVTFSISATKDSGADREYDFAIFKNGSIISKSEHTNITLVVAGAINIYVHTEIDLVTSDTIDLRVAGNGTADNATINTAHPVID